MPIVKERYVQRVCRKSGGCAAFATLRGRYALPTVTHKEPCQRYCECASHSVLHAPWRPPRARTGWSAAGHKWRRRRLARPAGSAEGGGGKTARPADGPRPRQYPSANKHRQQVGRLMRAPSRLLCAPSETPLKSSRPTASAGAAVCEAAISGTKAARSSPRAPSRIAAQPGAVMRPSHAGRTAAVAGSGAPARGGGAGREGAPSVCVQRSASGGPCICGVPLCSRAVGA